MVMDKTSQCVGCDGDWKSLLRGIWFWRFGQYDVDHEWDSVFGLLEI
jgi:hypothetical protein